MPAPITVQLALMSCLPPATFSRSASLSSPSPAAYGTTTYVEYAQEDRTFGQWWAFAHADRTPHALYAGTNLLWGPVTLSLEWKDYAQFRLGTNDPPSLIREHTAVLLNRHTHVLLAQREEGYQAELSWLFRDWATLVLNRSRADSGLLRHRPVYLGYRQEHPAVIDESGCRGAFLRDRGSSMQQPPCRKR